MTEQKSLNRKARRQLAASGVASPDASSDQAARPVVKAKPQPEGINTGLSPLALDGWLEYNRRKWNVEPRRLRYPSADAEQPFIEAVVYVDKGGQLFHPPRNPYLPVHFETTPTNLRYRQMRQWLDVSEMLVAETRRLGLRNTMNLPPDVTDIRPWIWAGFRAGVRYTLVIDFPFDPESIDKAIGRPRRKAEQAGFRCALTTDMAEVVACLADTESRQDFSLGLSQADLELAAELLGEEHFRAHVCYAPNGEPASAAIALSRPGAPAVGWIGGTRTEYLRSGPAQLLEFFAIQDLEQAGATCYDLAGANLPSIAAAKASWGARLEPYYTIEGYSARRLARWSMNWWKYIKQGRSG